MMTNKKSIHAACAFMLVFMFCSIHSYGQKRAEELRPDSIVGIMKRTTDWQWKNIAEKGWRNVRTDWTSGAMYTGLFSFAQIANDEGYLKPLVDVGEHEKWKTGKYRYFADEYCIGQTYSQLYQLYKRPEMIAEMRVLCDTIVARSHTEGLKWEKSIQLREWAWCDALFMGPPALAYLSTATGDIKYLDKSSELWWKTSDYLYDTKEHLYYRDSRYFDKKEKNGAKVFWSRGNGWVLAGMVRVLENMPANYKDRSRFIKQYKEMAEKVASLQQPDGSWHASLLDPASYPVKETSGTGFFCYALAWGIDQGILPANKYRSVVEKAWHALVTSVHEDGKLGFVQPQGASPDKVGFDDTDYYGVGAFLLAGTEMLQLSLKQDYKQYIEVKNPTGLTRNDLGELSWAALKKAGYGKSPFKLINALTREEIPYQIVTEGNKKPTKLVFQYTLNAGARAFLAIVDGAPAAIESKVFGRTVPERADDFAWENDRIAFRVYGPALEKTGEISNGIDVWTKRTSALVIDKWYKKDDYHKDHGEGLDAYKVGRTLGDGAMAPMVNDELILANNYVKAQILDKGPLRFTFQLNYAPFLVNGKQTTESRQITLDAGSYFNYIKVSYPQAGSTLKLAAGITLHKGDGERYKGAGVLGYWELADGGAKNGMIGEGLVFPAQYKPLIKEHQQHLLGIIDTQDNTANYYTGATWSKDRYADAASWFKALTEKSTLINNPIQVTIK